MLRKRSYFQKIKDFLTFPVRALFMPEKDIFGLSSWETERFDYAASEVLGYCLDVGCGHNRFIREFLNNRGKGIDIYSYEGLTEDNVVKDINYFPFPDATFNSVTFIASLNHISEYMRLTEVKEAYRCLQKNGNIIVTMGTPLLETSAHKLLGIYDKLFGYHDAYHSHGVEEEKIYYLTDKEISAILTAAGFKNIRKKYFLTQWGLNYMLIGYK